MNANTKVEAIIHEVVGLNGATVEVSDYELCRVWGKRARTYMKSNGNRPGVVWKTHRPRFKACCCKDCRDARELTKLQKQEEITRKAEAARLKEERIAAARKDLLKYIDPIQLRLGEGRHKPRGPRKQKEN